MSAKNVFGGGDILTKISEFCNELKRLALKAKERETEEERPVKFSQEDIGRRLSDDFVDVDINDKERTPFLDRSKENKATMLKNNLQQKQRTNLLVQNYQPGDSLLFHYSGNGSKLRDNNGDEVDGQDHRVRHTYKGSTGGTAISISACDDHQTSGDTTAFTGKANGSLTYSFIKTFECTPKMTYGQLLITYGAQVAVAGPNAPIQERQLVVGKDAETTSESDQTAGMPASYEMPPPA